MSERAFNSIAGAIFLVIALLHGLRLFFRWEAVIHGWTVPFWISWLAVFLFGFLGCVGFSKRH